MFYGLPSSYQGVLIAKMPGLRTVADLPRLRNILQQFKANAGTSNSAETDAVPNTDFLRLRLQLLTPSGERTEL